MRALWTLFFITSFHQIHAQSNLDCASEEGPIYKLVEDMPHPSSCEADEHIALCVRDAIHKFVHDHPLYQKYMYDLSDEGSVQLTYTVGTEGCITNVLVRRESDKGIGEKIALILQNMPKWKPGKTLGSAVRVRQHVTLSYQGNHTKKRQ